MAEVVYNSLQYLNDDDTRAMAIYLKSLAQGTSPEKPRDADCLRAESSLLLSLGQDRSTTANARAATARTGLGMPPHYPPLAGNQSIQMVSAVNRDPDGAQWRLSAGHGRKPDAYGMPPFAHVSDDEVAAVVTYIRTSWGNRGEPVSARAGQ